MNGIKQRLNLIHSLRYKGLTMKKKQSGSVLAISLVMLTAITLVAMISLERAALQTKIVANIQHEEGVFQACFNEQEFWLNLFSDPAQGKQRLFEIINDFSQNADGVIEQQLTQLNSGLRPQAANIPLRIQASALYFPEVGGLVEGFELGNYVRHTFQLDDDCDVRGRQAILSRQRTEFGYPSLTIANNSF